MYSFLLKGRTGPNYERRNKDEMERGRERERERERMEQKEKKRVGKGKNIECLHARLAK